MSEGASTEHAREYSVPGRSNDTCANHAFQLAIRAIFAGRHSGGRPRRLVDSAGRRIASLGVAVFPGSGPCLRFSLRKQRSMLICWLASLNRSITSRSFEFGLWSTEHTHSKVLIFEGEKATGPRRNGLCPASITCASRTNFKLPHAVTIE